MYWSVQVCEGTIRSWEKEYPKHFKNKKNFFTSVWRSLGPRIVPVSTTQMGTPHDSQGNWETIHPESLSRGTDSFCSRKNFQGYVYNMEDGVVSPQGRGQTCMLSRLIKSPSGAKSWTGLFTTHLKDESSLSLGSLSCESKNRCTHSKPTACTASS